MVLNLPDGGVSGGGGGQDGAGTGHHPGHARTQATGENTCPVAFHNTKRTIWLNQNKFIP